MAIIFDNTDGNTGQRRSLFLEYLLPVKKHLYNFIRKSMNFSAEADDIFQETLLKGFRYFYSFQRDKNFKTWIFTIAHNLMKDAYSAKITVNTPLSLEEAGEIAEIAAAESSDVREIYTAAAALKPRQRDVFFLYYYNEFKIPEIMHITGLSRANIKFMLHQARKTVKKILEVPDENGKKIRP